MMEYTIEQLIEELMTGIRASNACESKFVTIPMKAAREIKAHLECFRVMISEEDEDDGRETV